MHKKTFISYCWSNNAHVEWVIKLAELLTSNGIDILLDKWELKAGHDLTHFMENSITYSDKVLIICDKKYQEKSNARSGGVGLETSIITPDVYNSTKQEKFIPIFTEKDKDGKFYVPYFLKSRLGFDFSDKNKFDEKIEELLRTILNKPIHLKPNIGPIPTFDNKNIIKNRNANNYSISKSEILEKIYKNPFPNWECYDDEGIFILKEDIKLKIKRDDYENGRPFNEKWGTSHPDKNALTNKYFVYYNNNLVDEFLLISIDGGRVDLPLPKAGTNIIPKNSYLKAKAVDILGKLDEYIRRSKLIVE